MEVEGEVTFHFASTPWGEGACRYSNGVHAYMSPPPSAVTGEALFERSLSVAYTRLLLHLDLRRR
jgi:hypothetical protein